MNRLFFIYLFILQCLAIQKAWPLQDNAGISDPTRATIDSLDQIPPSSPYYAFAQQRLAELYLVKNTVNDRKKAVELIQKALTLQPQNLDFHLTHIRILFEQGFYRTADENCNRLLSLPTGPKQSFHSQYAEAYYYKGLVSERFALKYKDMISVIDENNYVSLANYGEEDLKRAAQWYEKAIEYNHTHRDALLHLGLLYYEIRGFDQMRKLFENILSRDPRDKDAYAFAALACYSSGQYEQAQNYYRIAMNFMTEQELAEFNHIGYIVPPSDQERYQSGAKAPSKAAEYQNIFWKQKDPMYLTAYNERLLEHYNRMTYAQLRFSVPRINIAGWKTDRGMIYIRYGKPVRQYKTQPDERKLGGSEVWVYPQFSFTFDDEYASGNFLMDQSSYLASRSAYNTKEESYAMPPERTFEMQSRIYQFKGSGGSTRARAYFQAFVNGIEPQQDVMPMDAEADCGLFFLDDDANIVHESRKRIALGRRYVIGNKFVSFIELDRMPTHASARRYSFELMTAGDHRTAVSRDSIRLRNFSDDRLMLSDVILASSITETAELKIVPNFTGTFSKSENMFLYFEVYNLLLNDENRGQYKISASIRRRGGGGLSGLVVNLLKDKKQGQIGSVFEITSYSRDDRYYFGLDLSDIPTGEYDLHLLITDTMANISAEQILPITIKTQNE
jgi:GWxTD domain-containing protein